MTEINRIALGRRDPEKLAAGFAPGSAEAKVLAKDIKAGAITAEDPETAGVVPYPATVAAYAADEYGWQPQVALYSRAEAVQLGGADSLAALSQASQSEGPPPDPELGRIGSEHVRFYNGKLVGTIRWRDREDGGCLSG